MAEVIKCKIIQEETKKKVIEQMEEIVKDITTIEEIAEIERMISEVEGKFREARPRKEVGLGYAGKIFRKTREIMRNTGMRSGEL